MSKTVIWLAATISSLVLVASFGSPAYAQSSSHLGSSSLNSGATEHKISVDELSVHESDISYPAAGISGPFAEWGFPTPPGAESYQVNQVSEDNLAPQGLEEWHPTDDPKETIAEGQMRSDHETVPEDFTKADADKAETTEAYLQSDAVSSLRTATGCSVYWPSWFEVCGAIKTKYDQIGGPTSFLNLPKSNELTNPDGVGKRSEFVNGFIYWHPDTGAQSVSIPVSKVWQRHGWEQGFLGYPITSDMTLGDQWFKQDFQGGHVYTHNAVPVSQASIQGAIYDKWQSMGAQKSELGYPISDELTTPDGVGRYNVFQGGMIYWTPTAGAHAVRGGILASWSAQGYEASGYGYPVGDMFINDQGAQQQQFEGGVLYADPNVFWQPFSCFHAVTRIAAQYAILDGVQYMCSNRGISFSVNGTDYFGMPTVEDVAKSLSAANSRAVRGAAGPVGVECDVYDSGLIGGPYRYSDYRVSKTIEFCIGETKPVSLVSPVEPKWSREFAWKVTDKLTQRRHGEVSTNVITLALPSFVFHVDTRLRQDRRARPDSTNAKTTSTVTQPGPNNASHSPYDIPQKPGTYFTEVDGISLKVSEWGYEASFGGYRFAIGRFECPQYTFYGNLCVFTNPVDDHT